MVLPQLSFTAITAVSTTSWNSTKGLQQEEGAMTSDSICKMQLYLKIATAVVAVTALELLTETTKKQNKKAGRKKRARTRRHVDKIYSCLGPLYFRRAYRMSYATFCLLSAKLEKQIQTAVSSQTARRRALSCSAVARCCSSCRSASVRSRSSCSSASARSR